MEVPALGDSLSKVARLGEKLQIGRFFQPVALFFPELLFPPIGLFLGILKK